MEVSTLKYGPSAVRWRSPLGWRQSDERLVASVRHGNHAAFTVLVKRYETRLLVFCRQMLRSREDAEDVLQEVFVAAFNAMIADDRPLNVQPWLYRIARNRSLNHLRRVKAISVDPMEMPEAEAGGSTADTVHRREELRLLVDDIQSLPESQRSALVLREMEALSYDQIAEVMDKSVPSVKSLLVRARVALAAAREGRATGKRVAALLPFGPIAVLKRFALCHVGRSTGAGATAAGAGGAMVTGSSSGGMVVAGIGAMATKTAAGLAAAALVTAGAVAIESGPGHHHHKHHHLGSARAGRTTDPAPAQTARAPQAPSVVAAVPAHVASRPPTPPAQTAQPASATSTDTRHTPTATAAAAPNSQTATPPPTAAVQQPRAPASAAATSGASTKVTTDSKHAEAPVTATVATTKAPASTTGPTTTAPTTTTATTTTATTTTATTTTATTTTATGTTTSTTAADTRTSSSEPPTTATSMSQPSIDASSEAISPPAAVSGDPAKQAAGKGHSRRHRRWPWHVTRF
ncbi:MAG: sigma-70 family RNA polymerase sigma factor [Solirubrobacterales bacterium]|nr:sigma-70 family RNA polymerase sigma factor [Solirubrobacterales bacterium]